MLTRLMGFMALPMGNPTNAFYDSWADYLQPQAQLWLKAAQILGQWIADLFYDLGNAVLTAWQSAWQLADFSTLFTKSTGGNDLTGYHLAQYIGVFFMIGLIVLAIMMAVQMIQFSLTSGERGKEWPRGVFIALVIILFVPTFITAGNQVGRAMNDSMLGSHGSQNNSQNILTDIWKNNSVDLVKVANANFDVNEKDLKNYSPIGKNSSASIVKSSIFRDVMSDDILKNNTNKNVREVFKKKQSDGANPVDLDKGSFLTKSTAAEVYPRVKVNWVGIILAEIVFACVGFFAIIELLVRFYRLAYYSITLLAFAFRDMAGKKALEILHTMEGSIVGIALLPLNLLLFFGFIQWGMTTIGKIGLSWGPYTILSVALMAAGAKGLLGGFALIDDWTGVPTGHGATISGMVNAGATGAAIGRSTAGAGKAALGTVGAVTDGVSRIAKTAVASDRAQKIRESMMEKGNESGLLLNSKLPNRDVKPGALTNDMSGNTNTSAEKNQNDEKPDDTKNAIAANDKKSEQDQSDEKNRSFADFTGPNGEPAQAPEHQDIGSLPDSDSEREAVSGETVDSSGIDPSQAAKPQDQLENERDDRDNVAGSGTIKVPLPDNSPANFNSQGADHGLKSSAADQSQGIDMTAVKAPQNVGSMSTSQDQPATSDEHDQPLNLNQALAKTTSQAGTMPKAPTVASDSSNAVPASGTNSPIAKPTSQSVTSYDTVNSLDRTDVPKSAADPVTKEIDSEPEFTPEEERNMDKMRKELEKFRYPE